MVLKSGVSGKVTSLTCTCTRILKAVHELTESEGDSGLGRFVIQDAGWSGGQHPMTRPLSNDLRERVVAAGELPRGSCAVWRCGVLGGEVVAAFAGDRVGCARQDGRAPQARTGAASRVHP